ncbi:MAG TPA: toll/interleukin-1 receptor domain-containing protein [Pirellulales bacterium]|jgi:hypothetical protein|nr:toll/interleukin-1 receptor domain-containing protein [Pirellulales bacterium]
MATSAKTYDIFISHGAADSKAAADLAAVLRANDLEPFTGDEVGAGENFTDLMWEALAESKALLAILSRSELSSSMAFEIGAAQAWSKPIYAIVADPSSVRLPASLAHVRHIAPGGIEEVIYDLKHSADVLTAEDQRVLAEAYSESGVSVDAFALDHQQLRKLTEKFNRKTGKIVTGERLLFEMLRMRKRGILQRFPAKHPRPKHVVRRRAP